MKKIIFYIYKKCWDIIANPRQQIVLYLSNTRIHFPAHHGNFNLTMVTMVTPNSPW